MILPSPRWYRGAAALALLAPLALLDPRVAAAFLAADSLWVGLLLADAWRISRLDLRNFPVRRDSPPAFSVDRQLPVRYRWGNPSRRALTLLVREELPAPLARDGAGERRLTVPVAGLVEEVLVRPARRGRATGGRLSLRALAPLGLAWKQGRRDLPWEVTVYPSLRRVVLRALPASAQRRREAGLRNLRRIGEGRLFESLREWVPGEEPRIIDWKATARRGKLMARQYEDERRQRVMIVLDAGRLLTAESGDRPRLEEAIEAALSLAHSVVAHDDDIGLMVFADEVLRYVPPARGRRGLRAVLDGLAAVEGRVVEPDYPAAFSTLAGRNRKRALTVIFTDVIDRTASDALVAQAGTLRPRHLPLAVTLRDPALEALAAMRPSAVDQAFERAAAEELLGAREEALGDLRARGVMVLDVLPRQAARAVVEQYEKLKRRALL